MSTSPQAFKISIVGDPKVGKTSLRKKYMGENLDRAYMPTLGVDFASLKVSKELDGQDHNILLQIWDLSGQHTFVDIRNRFLKGTHLLLVVYDITNDESYQNTWEWLDSTFEILEPNNSAILLLANKADLSDQRKVSYEMGLEHCQAIEKRYQPISTEFLETSALTGYNVIEAFDKALTTILVIASKGML